MDKEIRVLLVEDSAADAELVARELVKKDLAHISKLVQSKDEFLKALGEFAPDIVLCDYKLPMFGAPEALEILKKSYPETPLIVVSGTIGEDIAVDTMKLGAVDYIMKDRLVRLVPAIRRALEEARIASERKQAEESLRESEERYKNLFKANVDGILIVDVMTRKFRYANPAICRILGYSEEELLRMGVADIHPKDSLEQVSAEFEAQVSGAKTIANDLPCVRKDGQIISVSINACTVMIDHQTKYLMGIFRDITEHKQTEKTQKRLVAIIEATSDFVGFADAKDKHIIYVNKAGRKMCGIGDDEDVTKLKFYDVHPEWINKMYAEEILPAAVRDGVWTGECAFLNIIDRHEIPVLMVLSAHKAPNGEVEVFSTISRNITDRKQAEESLKQAKTQAEAANEAKNQFLANMSHEMRTPLNAIIGFSKILMQEELAEEHKEHLKMIYDSGTHLLGLINDILNISSIETSKINIKMNQCSLGHVIANIESMMQPFATGKGLTFEIREKGDLPANIVTDGVRLQQCLTNLVNNAIKFTEQGHIYVNISLEDKDSKPRIRFEVEDTGIGITPEFQQKIFEPFVQEDDGTSRKYGGTGLGLAITRKFAVLLGGEITLTSEKGKGSVFSLIIPAGVDLTAQPLLNRRKTIDEASKVKQDRFSGCILVAEDVKTNQVLMKFLLEKIGLKVTIAENGAEAVDKALGQKFDLIFMDIQMPKVNGYEATRTLRDKGFKMPIVALTAGTMEGDEAKCIEAGCDVYLSKPVVISKLIETLSKYLPSENQVLIEAAGSS